MTEPTAPSIPADAPQDVKDFFDCKGNKLVWQSGEVTWLGLKVTPNVGFAQDPKTGAITIKVSILGGMVSFDLPASVNAAGELVVDTSSVPDLSEWGIGGRTDIDAAIKNINDWFKKNGKKLKPAKLVGGTVVLEKTPIGPAPAKIVPVVPLPPVTPPPATPKPVAPPPASPPPSSGGGCGLLGMLMLLMVVGVIALGVGVGFVFFGGPQASPVAQATATPSASPHASPSASPAASATASPSAAPSATPAATPSEEPTPTPTSSIQAYISGVCARVKHSGFGDFVSYIDWLMFWDGFDVDHFLLTIGGTNDGAPVTLVFDPADGSWNGRLGLHSAGDKPITSLVAVLEDGTPIDITDELTELLGMTMLPVQYPQEDTFGICPIE